MNAEAVRQHLLTRYVRAHLAGDKDAPLDNRTIDAWDELVAENARLRAALAFYADDDHWTLAEEELRIRRESQIPVIPPAAKGRLDAAEARVVLLEAQLAEAREACEALMKLAGRKDMASSEVYRAALDVQAMLRPAAAVSVADSDPEDAHPDWIGGCPVYGRERGTAGCERCGGDIITCPVYGPGERKRREEDAARPRGPEEKKP